jgi:hypothetical protein
MVYVCRDCSYKGTKRADDGHCPACGSPKFRLAAAAKSPGQPQKRNRSLALLVLLWGYLIAHVCWKLYN